MNICLMFVCMVGLPIVAGRGALAVLYRRQAEKFYMADHLIVGWLVTIGLAEAAHLAAVFLGWQFSRAVGLWAVAFLAVVCICGMIWFVTQKGNSAKVGKREPLGKRKGKAGGGGTPLRFAMFLALALMVIWQIMTIVSQESVYRGGDMTVETVESFLETDRVYDVNPLTGRPYEIGIPFRIKILCVPTLYGALCSLFHVEAVSLVWKYVPVMVLLLCYGTFWLIAKALFDGGKDANAEKDKRLLFMVLVALVFCVGDYAYGMDGFGLLHCGFRGVTIRNMVLVPYAFGLALRRKWRPALILVLAEACIAWTLYGLGICVIVLGGMGAICILKNRKTAGFQRVREEA